MTRYILLRIRRKQLVVCMAAFYVFVAVSCANDEGQSDLGQPKEPIYSVKQNQTESPGGTQILVLSGVETTFSIESFGDALAALRKHLQRRDWPQDEIAKELLSFYLFHVRRLDGLAESLALDSEPTILGEGTSEGAFVLMTPFFGGEHFSESLGARVAVVNAAIYEVDAEEPTIRKLHIEPMGLLLDGRRFVSRGNQEYVELRATMNLDVKMIQKIEVDTPP